jgi:hypothetical protein
MKGNARCPASLEEKKLVEDGFRILEKTLGRERLKNATVVEPTPAFFPDRFDASEEAVIRLFARVCRHMSVNPESVQLGFWKEEREEPEIHPLGVMADPKKTSGASGYYAHAEGKDHILINVAEVNDPEGLVSTMAHELSHVILLARHRMSTQEPHMEALTDLTPIFLGFGIFIANTLLRRHGWTRGNVEGWSVQRKGYISPEMAGWALTLFCWSRGEVDPRWSKYLAVDPKAYLKMGLRYLAQTGDTTFS